ncbi:hypothetical protein D3C81_1621860 [compost metagenome]
MPDHQITSGVPTTNKFDFKFAAIATQINCVIVGDFSWSSKPRNTFRLLEQSRHAAKFTVPVLLATLFNQLRSIGTSQDMFCIKGASAQNPDSMVMAQNQVFDRLVGVLTQFAQPDIS